MANEYTAPISGLKIMLFIQGTMRYAARFTETLNKLARNVGIQAWSQSTVSANGMIELVAPSWTEPVKPTRMYYLPVTQGDPVTIPRAHMIERFTANTKNRNIEVDGDIDWKMTLSKWYI